MIIKGQNVRIKVGGAVVACATSCTCHGSAQLEEAGHKDAVEDWTEQETVGKSWDASVDALVYVAGSEGTSYSGKTVQDLWDMLGEKVDIEFTQLGTTTLRHGTAILNDISETHANKQNSTFTAQFTGCGELKNGAKGA